MNNSLRAPCLTNLSIAGGCGCKLDPSKLKEILSQIKSGKPQGGLVVGFDTADDCAVYEYAENNYLLFTTDFFTPLIDDPFMYGSLAAANALSDVFAMGGKPLIANAILGFPPEHITPTVVKEIVRGAESRMDETGCLIVGGHTIINPQPIYGFSIIGKVEKENLKTNKGAKEEDLIVMTKPIGSGILSNALKLGLLSDQYYQNLIPWLLEMNSVGYELGYVREVTAMTDITGFGLVGHLLEMAEGANLFAEVDISAITFFEGSEELCSCVLSPHSGAIKNYNSYHSKVTFDATCSLDKKHMLCDPQSNGGLLIAVSPEGLNQVQALLEKKLGRKGLVIGNFQKKQRDHYSLRVYG